MMTGIDSTGSGIFVSGSALFYVKALELSAGEVALALTIAGALGLLVTIPSGMLADKVGYRRFWLLLTVAQVGLYGAFPFVRGFAAFACFLGLLTLIRSSIEPVRGAYIAELAPPAERVAARAQNRVIFNVGFSAGAVLAALALQVETREAYAWLAWGNALSLLIVAALISRLPESVRRPVAQSAAKVRRAVHDRPYLAIAAADGLLCLHITIFMTAMPIWVAQRTDLPLSVVPMLFVLNTALVVLLQVRASRSSASLGGAVRAMRNAGLLLALGCVALAAAERLPEKAALALVVAAAVLLTVGELFQSAGGWGISHGLAPEQQQAEYLGAFGLGVGLQEVLGPVLVLGLVLALPVLGWLLLAVVFIVSGAAVRPLVARCQRGRVAPEAVGVAM